MDALKIIAAIAGAVLLAFGTGMWVLAKMFGAGGPFDRYRRDVSTEVFFVGLACAGVGLIGWAAVS